MSIRSDKAVKLFREGYNCSQAVSAAFCDITGMDEDTALKTASSFGGGMGRLREVCGAVTGMFMAAGMLYGYSDPSDKAAKDRHYRLIRMLAERFRRENGSVVCRELLSLPSGASSPVSEERTQEYYKKRPCTELVRCAAEILDDYIEKEKNDHENSSSK